jgi:glutathione peroxidase
MKLESIKIIIITLALSLQLGGFSRTVTQNIEGDNLKDNINDIKVIDMENNSIQLSDYNGKVLLIVNVASECGYTSQYTGLEEIYRKYNSLGFEILAFPCNDFGSQEPGTNDEIKTFCSSNYNVTFKLFDKIKILGEDKSPLYERLTNNSKTDKSDINWNFEKFIISKDGKITARFLSKIKPTGKAITKLIEEELEKE